VVQPRHTEWPSDGGLAGASRRGPILLAGRIARTLRLVVDEWRWPVVPGAYVTRTGICSCGDRRCPEPGSHPVDPVSWLAASADPDRVHGWWLATPLASIVMPVGWHADLLDVPERGGLAALDRLAMMGYRSSPSIATASGRMLFLVAASARRPGDPGHGEPAGVPRPETALWLGGDASGAADIVVRRRGTTVLPPFGPESPGVTRWVEPLRPERPPLPRVEDLLGPVLHACREVVVRRSRRSGRLAAAVAGRTAALSGGTVPVPNPTVASPGDSANDSVLSARRATGPAPDTHGPSGGTAAPPDGTAWPGAALAGSSPAVAGAATASSPAASVPEHGHPDASGPAAPQGTSSASHGPAAQPSTVPATSSARALGLARSAGATGTSRLGQSYPGGRVLRPSSPRGRGEQPPSATFAGSDTRTPAEQTSRGIRVARSMAAVRAAAGSNRNAESGRNRIQTPTPTPPPPS
jgi:hypothetical protein